MHSWWWRDNGVSGKNTRIDKGAKDEREDQVEGWPRRKCQLRGVRTEAMRSRRRSSGSKSTARGFEPLRAEPNGFLVHHLSHSVTLSLRYDARLMQGCWIPTLEHPRVLSSQLGSEIACPPGRRASCKASPHKAGHRIARAQDTLAGSAPTRARTHVRYVGIEGALIPSFMLVRVRRSPPLTMSLSK